MRPVSRHSPLTGKLNTLMLDVTLEQMVAWRGGALIQHVMPHLTPEEREFIVSGLVPGEFDLMWKSTDFSEQT